MTHAVAQALPQTDTRWIVVDDDGGHGITAMPTRQSVSAFRDTLAELHHAGWVLVDPDDWYVVDGETTYRLLKPLIGRCRCLDWTPCGGVTR